MYLLCPSRRLMFLLLLWWQVGLTAARVNAPNYKKKKKEIITIHNIMVNKPVIVSYRFGCSTITIKNILSSMSVWELKQNIYIARVRKCIKYNIDTCIVDKYNDVSSLINPFCTQITVFSSAIKASRGWWEDSRVAVVRHIHTYTHWLQNIDLHELLRGLCRV